ncbi:hypothetical protein FIM66_07920 [Helicobacter pylori]|nr:hypothetical protein FIM66_07920 [Helicobacter pylori]
MLPALPRSCSNFFFKASLRALSCSLAFKNSCSLCSCSLCNLASFSALTCSKGLKGSYVLSAFVVGLFSTEFKE